MRRRAGGGKGFDGGEGEFSRDPGKTVDMQAPALTRAQVREVDRIAIEEIGIPGIVLMENAARGLADAARELVEPAAARVAIVCGGGNNGGDGYALARHLHNAGAEVRCYAVKPVAELRGDAAVNAGIAERMGLPVETVAERGAIEAAAPGWRDSDLVVDALLGTGFAGTVRDPVAAAIERINAAPAVLAVDIPSGLDADAGEPSNATVRATATVTFVAEKVGFRAAAARPYLGALHVAGIGAPRELIDRVA